MFLTLGEAIKNGEHVRDGFLRTTADGKPVCVFIWGELLADGTDTRGAEVISSQPLGRMFLRATTALWLLDNVALLDHHNVTPALRKQARKELGHR